MYHRLGPFPLVSVENKLLRDSAELVRAEG